MAVNKFVDKFFKKILGTSSETFLKKANPIVQEINDLEPADSETFRRRTSRENGRIQGTGSKSGRRH